MRRITALIILAFFITACGSGEPAKPRDPIMDQFSPWDGSHRNLETYIKARMNDPESYEHVSTTYGKYDTHLIVVTFYRGRNGFGGMVRGGVKAKISLTTGKVLDIIGQE